MSENKNTTPVAENENGEAVASEESKTVGAPTQTPNDVISDLLPAERVSRSKALNIVRGQDLKCSQERMTVIMEAKYGAAPTKDERDAERAAKAEAKKTEKEAAQKVKAEERAKVKAEKAEKVAAEKAEKAKLAADVKAKREAAKTDAAKETAEKPAV